LGGGIGVGLLSALIDSAEPRLGLTRLQLTVFADNQRAIALYQRFGFAVEGTLRA
jgi:putative acetyltransferase